MTTLVEKEKKCYVCGATNKYTDIASTNRRGSPDLDTRPPEMMRSTILYWIQRCPSCGYCAPEVSIEVYRANETVKSKEYQQLVNDSSYPELANRFRGWALIQETVSNDVEAGWRYVHAAWTCDDADATDLAIVCRLKAIQLFQHSKVKGVSFAEDVGVEEAILADLLRRSGNFNQTIEVSQEGLRKKPEEMVSNILSYQIDLARQGDTKCHVVNESLENIASRPTSVAADAA